MGRVNTPELSKESIEELELLQVTSTNGSLRKRCQLILLKSDGRSSKDVGEYFENKPCQCKRLGEAI